MDDQEVTLDFENADPVRRIEQQFLLDWQAGKSPRIEELVADAAVESKNVLVERLVVIDARFRKASGEPVSAAEYMSRLGGFEKEVSRALEISNQETPVAIDHSLIETHAFSDSELDGTEDFTNPDSPIADERPLAKVSQSNSQKAVNTHQFGRYRVERELGQGGFGTVYLAVDDELQRRVAIKVASKAMDTANSDSYLTEARTVATLEHAHIVPVYDVGRTDTGEIYVVSRFIEGTDLKARIDQELPLTRQAVAWIATLADALHYAHTKGLVHRDVKPGNVLLDLQDQVYLCDFGLALREEQFGQGPTLAGTPAYMSPEQARGEGHRVDGRSDIYSLGVVLYELLTGKRPFTGDTLQLLRSVAHDDPRPLRQIDDSLSPELERITFKCLAKRASDRYLAATDLADDLRAFLEGKSVTEQQSVKIVPKGLRSFDARDSDFFIELLPGVRDRNGLPDSITFWKHRLEERDADQTFGVGMICGPSGCGKSSLVKAGLLPNLAEFVRPVYIEATADTTEARLLGGLRKACPELPAENSLKDAIARLRLGQSTRASRKVVLILDQFEQWLYARNEYGNTELADALRQCDGGNVQAVVMVRDDFWMAASRLFRDLDVPLLERHNTAAVDLFDMPHAHNVLAKFGQAFGRLPENLGQLDADQERFLDDAVTGLATDGKVISVRLALFAEMVKSKPWTPTTLRQLGGISGVGVVFLEETFSSASASPAHRHHQQAARAVLSELLPDEATDIKGRWRSEDQLREVSGYANRPQEFNDLLRILDSQLRLITPVDAGEDQSRAEEESNMALAGLSSENQTTEDNRATLARRSFQLTHDFLVPSLRSWLTQKQRETKRGRAELRLAERADIWNLKPENRNLPSLWEWLTIRRLTDRQRWKPNEQTVMRRAGRVHATRAGILASAIAILAMLGIVVRGQVIAQQELARVKGLVSQLVTAEPAQLPDIVSQLQQVPELAEPLVLPLLQLDPATADERRSKLHAQLSAVGRDATLIDPLVEELLSNKVAYIGPIVMLIQPYSTEVKDKLSGLLQDPKLEANRRFRAGVALAGFADPSDTWDPDDLKLFADQLVSANAEYQPTLRENLRPIADQLLVPIEVVFKDLAASDAMRLGAANAVADFAANDGELLTRLLADATPEQYDVLYPLVETSRPAEGISELARIAATLPPDDLGSVPRIAYGQRRANAAVSLLRLGERENVLPVFDYTDDPEALTQFIFRCRPRGIEPLPLMEVLEILTESVSEGPSNDISRAAFQQNTRARYAVLLALGEFTLDELPVGRRESLIALLAQWYANDPSSGVHGASGWLLRQWGENEIVTQVDQTPVPYSPDREWFTLAITVRPTPPPKPKPENEDEADASEAKSEESDTEKSDSGNPDTEPQEAEPPSDPLPQKTFYYTFIVHPSGEYTIGSVEDEVDRNRVNEVRHTVTLTRPFAMLDREITFEELLAFSPEYAGFMQQCDAAPNDAGFGAHWYDSVAFCRWLGEEMGLAEADQCYADPETLDKEQYPRDPQETSFPRNWPLDLSKRGFRLPTESEWEVMSRSGSRTAYGYGSEVALLEHFGWFKENSGKKVHPGREKRPSVRGLFDLHGNLFEWTHDWNKALGESGVTDPLGASDGSNRVLRGGGWAYVAASCRAANRDRDTPTNRFSVIGFRLALVPSGPGGTGAAEPGTGAATGAEGDQRREE